MGLDFERLEHVLAGAAAKADPVERAAFLAQACGEDRELRAEAERLLAAHQQAGDFLETPILPAADGLKGSGSDNTKAAPESGLGIEGAGAMIGRYKLLEEIGEGAFGVVFTAEQVEPVQRKVALKIIKAGMDTREVILRFEAERQALALMDHPNIARILDGGTTRAGRPYFVMELVQGIAITDFSDQRRLTTAERLHLFIRVCHAVQHAHQKGIIHRDLKPSNILVTIIDGQPAPKVIDFGVAKALGRKLTDKTLLTGLLRMVGTPAYMSPEQAELGGVDIDTRSDIYALGVLLYELLAGVTPFDTETLRNAALNEIGRLIRETEPLKPSTRISRLQESKRTTVAQRRRTEPATLMRLLSGDLDWIAMKCLEKDRARRYESAGGLAADIERHLGHEPITARPPSKLYQFQKLVQKNKLVFAAGSVALSSLVVGLAVATLLFFRERSVRRQADEQAAVAKAVNDFLQNDLLRQANSRAQADAQFKADPNLTVREALQRASERIGGRFAHQPLTELAIRLAIGDALRGVGQETQAMPHLLRAMDLSRTVLGAEHLDTLKCMDDLAATYTEVGDLDHALPLLEKALALRKARLGPNHEDTLTTMRNLGAAYKQAGKLNEAILLLKETLKLQKASLGPDHPKILGTMAELGAAYYYTGDLDQALLLSEETLKLRKARLGPDHPDTLLSVNSLVAVYIDSGRLEQALRLLEENLESQIARLGPNHPEILTSKHNLGLAYGDAGKLDQAKTLLEEVLKTRRATLGSDHPHTLLTMNLLADAYQQAGNLDQAISLFEEALRLARGKLGPDHFVTLMLMGNAASAYQEAGKHDQALPLYDETATRTKAKLGPDNPHALQCLGGLAFAYEAAGLPEKALPLLEQTLSLEKAKLGPQHEYTLTTMNDLALTLQETGKLDQALPLLEETFRLSKARFGADHRVARRAVNDLAGVYEEAGRLDRALPLLEEALRSMRLKLGPQHPDTLATEANLSRCQLFQGNYADAQRLARECFELSRKSTPNGWRTFAVQVTLGRALLGQGNFGEAEPLLLQGYLGLKDRQHCIPAGSRSQLRQAVQGLVHLYEAWGKPSDAAKWKGALEVLPQR